MSDHDDFAPPSPVRGLPAALPEGEEMLWQGAPAFMGLAVRALHVRLIALYFVLLFVWEVISPMIQEGAGFALSLVSAMSLIMPAVVVVGLVVFYAWLYARATVYTITTKRVAIQYGLAFPRTINLPFTAIRSASLKVYPDGTGDLPLEMISTVRLAYLQLWPLARPWHVSRAQPMLRCVKNAEEVATILADALHDASVGTSGGDNIEKNSNEQNNENNLMSLVTRGPVV